MFRKLLCLGLFNSWICWGSSLKLDSRLEHQITQNDLAVVSAYYQSSPIWKINLETAGRVSVSIKDLENWSYSLGGIYPYFLFSQPQLVFPRKIG